MEGPVSCNRKLEIGDGGVNWWATVSIVSCGSGFESEKRELEKTLASLNSGLEERLTDSVGELSSYDQHAADLGQETYDRAKDLALRDNTQRLLKDTEAALESMARGEYGVCQECGQPIDERRLRAIPSAVLCFACKNAEESRLGRLGSPGGREGNPL